MKQNLLPLSSVCHCWTGWFIPEAMAAVERGITRERDRFQECPFVVLLIQHEVDYDGMISYLDLLKGFASEEEAVIYAQAQAEETLSGALADQRYTSLSWKVAEPLQQVADRQRLSEHIERVCLVTSKVETGSGFDFKYFNVFVLHVDTPEIVGPELFCCIGEEFEWVSFLKQQGKE